MKIKLMLLSCISLIGVLASCKKENNSVVPSSNTNLVRIQEGTDPIITNDTVFLITYDASKRISSIIDSLYQDTLRASYDASGNLSTITETFGSNASFTFDGSGLLSKIDYQLAGSHEQYVFEYTNGIVSKKTYNSNLGSGPVSKQGYFVYTVIDGNITDVKAYSAGGSFLSEITCTYGTQLNGFKSLSVFDYGNILGTDDIITTETYFNKNNLISFTVNGSSVSSAYTFNSNQQTSKIITTDNINSGLFTWAFSYK